MNNMLEHNPMFEVEYFITLNEVMKFHPQYPNFTFPITETRLFELMNDAQVIRMVSGHPEDFLYNDYKLVYVSEGEHSYLSEASIDELALTFFNKMGLRFGEHYVGSIKDINTSDFTLEKVPLFVSFFRKVFNKLDYSFSKYKKLFSLYESQESHLLDKLQRTRGENKSISSENHQVGQINDLSLHNDTPQTTDVVATIEGNQYVSDLDKQHTSSSSDGATSGSEATQTTEAYDPETMIERLSEIRKKYAKLWEEWLDEFDDLFIEEVNF